MPKKLPKGVDWLAEKRGLTYRLLKRRRAAERRRQTDAQRRRRTPASTPRCLKHQIHAASTGPLTPFYPSPSFTPQALQPLRLDGPIDPLLNSPAGVMAAPSLQLLERPIPFCHTLEIAQAEIALTKAAIERLLSERVMPTAFVKDTRSERETEAMFELCTCGGFYLCGEAHNTDDSAVSCAYCMAGTLIGTIA